MARAKPRRAKNKNNDMVSFRKGILDVIEVEYNDRYVIISEDYDRIKALFSGVEWIDILTKSRNSLERDNK